MFIIIAPKLLIVSKSHVSALRISIYSPIFNSSQNKIVDKILSTASIKFKIKERIITCSIFKD